jgi:hypothetical protein
MPRLTTATISLELLQDCLGTLEQLTTGITNLGVEATSNSLQAPRVRVLLEDLLTSLQNCENDWAPTREVSLTCDALRCIPL